MLDIVFATNNQHKIEEAREILGNKISIIGLKELGFCEEIPETANTIEGNAKMKAAFIFDKFGMPCIADDTGLEIAYLDHAPGVYSARYAGNECNDDKNIDKVLCKLQHTKQRAAQFRTVIALHDKTGCTCFEGIVKGTILHEKVGEFGFGYDSIFSPLGHSKSFAQMTAKEKNSISHRALAMQQFIKYVNNNF